MKKKNIVYENNLHTNQSSWCEIHPIQGKR